MTERDVSGPRWQDATADPWGALRAETPARIGLGRSGDAMPMRSVLDLQLAHAKARDAVHAQLDVPALEAALAPCPTIRVRSAATDRSTYLRRPDLGRRLDERSEAMLGALALGRGGEGGFDLAFVVADGLSATAAGAHAAPLIHACLARLEGVSIAPVAIAEQARVALGDPIGSLLRARLAVVLIGERPGLSVADSLGAYLTYDPRQGRRDSERNCISNIHARGGLPPQRAADTLAWLVRQALHRGLTGIGLKAGMGDTLGTAAPDLPTSAVLASERCQVGTMGRTSDCRPSQSNVPRSTDGKCGS